MGILNLTPDSFFEESRVLTFNRCFKKVEELITNGADLIDIGAESTRPGFTPISLNTEIKRLGQIVLEIKKKFNIPISVDTTKPEVAKIVLNQGADLINNVSGKVDLKMLEDVIKFKAAYCFMHNEKIINSSNFLNEVTSNLHKNLNKLLELGLDKNKIIIDPGLGFNKTFNENLILLNNLNIMQKLKVPILIGASNKSFIGQVLNEPIVGKRLFGTVAISAIATFCKVAIVRVHDVKENVQAIKIANFIRNS